jgi:DNA-binding LacI/PurR family transcriptional regulator
MVNRQAIQPYLKRDDIAGYLVNLWTGGKVDWKQEMVDNIQIIAQTGLPTAIIDHETQLLDGIPTKLPQRVQVFRDGSTQAGRMMAKMLLEKGHRAIAYIGLWHRQQWSQERLQGLGGVYQQAGYPDKVIPITAESSGLSSLPEYADAALSHQDISALVCSSDSTALALLNYLAKKKVAVPKKSPWQVLTIRCSPLKKNLPVLI